MASTLANALDVDTVLASLNERVPEYLSVVRSKVDSALRNSTTANLLEMTISCPGSHQPWVVVQTERPPFNADWVELFIKYLRGKSVGKDRKLEVGVEKLILKACIEASEQYFNSPETYSFMAAGIASKIETNEDLKQVLAKELKTSTKFVKNEAQTMVAIQGHTILADRAHDALILALHSTLGTTLGALIMKALMLPAVKLAITHAIQVALANAAFHQFLVILAHKVGITVLLVIILGSSSAMIIPFLAIPIIAVVLTYQYENLPETFADKMVPELMEALEKKVPDINKTVAETFVKVAKEKFAEMGDELLAKLRETDD